MQYGVGTAHILCQWCGDTAQHRKNHIFYFPDNPRCISNWCGGLVGGCLLQLHYIATLWLHLASWNFPDSQHGWESKMELECGKIWILKQREPYSTTRDRNGQHRTTQGHTGPYGIMQDRAGPFWTIQDHTGPFATIRDHTDSTGSCIKINWDYRTNILSCDHNLQKSPLLHDFVNDILTMAIINLVIWMTQLRYWKDIHTPLVCWNVYSDSGQSHGWE